MTSQDQGPTFYVIAAHGGAGYHPPTTDSSLKSGLRAAISSALTALPGTGTTTTSGAASSDTSSSESSALDAATIIITALENAPDFNAGYGSNLTYDGDVECDASLMLIEEDEKSHDTADTAATTTLDSDPSSWYSYSFGSVGAVRGVRNPVLLARRVLEGRRRRRRRKGTGAGAGAGAGTGTTIGLGRVPPLMVVGEGAAQFAREQGLPVIVDPDRLEEEMVAPRARREWKEWREREREWREQQQQQQQQEGREEVLLLTPRARSGGPTAGGCDDNDDNDNDNDGEVGPLHARQDTVGAVVLVGGVGDVRQQQIAAGVSSGGLLLKHSGRVGEAAVFGAGCWVERTVGGRKVACSVSGQGELIVQSNLARMLAERSVASNADSDDTHEVLRSVLVDDFYRKWHRLGEYQPAVGVLLLTQGVDGDEDTARLWCAFTTQSMAVAYASSRHPKAKATILRNTAHDFTKDDDGRPPIFITSFSC